MLLCVLCGRQPRAHLARCDASPGSAAWIVTRYDITGQYLVKSFKSSRAVEALQATADILDASLPCFPESTVVTAPPTNRRHIRQRGYDHTARIARQLAAHRGLAYRPLFMRLADTVQRGATRRQRIAHAQHSLGINPEAPLPKHVLLIDDVITTGATVMASAQLLQVNGVQNVWIAAFAYQPLD